MAQQYASFGIRPKNKSYTTRVYKVDVVYEQTRDRLNCFEYRLGIKENIISYPLGYFCHVIPSIIFQFLLNKINTKSDRNISNITLRIYTIQYTRKQHVIVTKFKSKTMTGPSETFSKMKGEKMKTKKKIIVYLNKAINTHIY